MHEPKCCEKLMYDRNCTDDLVCMVVKGKDYIFNMVKEHKAVSAVTLPLKTEKWQEDILFKRFELCRNIYNAMLGYEWEQYRKMYREPLYQEAVKTICTVCQIDDEKEKAKSKKGHLYKEAVEIQKSFLKKYGFSEYEFVKTAGRFYKIFSKNISSNMTSLSIAKPMWSAFEKMLFGNGRTVHLKKYDTWKSIVSDGKSGIRIVNEFEHTIFHWNGKEKLYVLMGGRTRKKIKIPVKIDVEDAYLLEMLDRDIKTVRIIRKKVRGRYKYYVQLCVEGKPAVKYDMETGEIKHPIKIGRVGMYVDDTSCTVFSNQGKKYYDVSQDLETCERRQIELQRYMDHSRRAANPENYNEDGSIKKGQWKNGRRIPLSWSYSKGYMKAKNELANLYRITAEQRKLTGNRLANEILTLGNEIVVNEFHDQNILAACIARLDQRLKVNGYAGVERVLLEYVDDTIENYREHYAKLLYEGKFETV